MNPQVLIVENNPRERALVEVFLKRIEASRTKPHGIERFDVTMASTAKTARQFLQDAHKNNRPYDLLMLDLGLPEEDESAAENTIRGFEILTFVEKTEAARAVLVLSKYDDYEFVAPVFRGGALDFLAKASQLEEDAVQRAVLASWDRVLIRESAQIFEDRIKTLLRCSNRGLAYRFGACFSRFLQSVLNEAGEMRSELSQRLGLEIGRDNDDSLVQHLAAVKVAAEDSRKEWGELQRALGDGNDAPTEIPIDGLLKTIKADLVSCLVMKATELELESVANIKALSFQQDVLEVLREIILGSLAAIPNGRSTPTKIAVRTARSGNYCEVVFIDNMSPLSEERASSINRGSPLAADPLLGREWGLSVAQHVALRGGGRLVVKSSATGNSITYFIPLAEQ